MELLIESIVPGQRIVDVQKTGPFQYWRHEHAVEARSEMDSVLTDIIDFRFFGGPAGRLLDRFLVRPLLWFEFRRQHRRLRQIIDQHRPLWRRWLRR